MIQALLVLLFIAVLAIAFLGWRLLALKREFAALDQRLADTSESLGANKPDLARLLGQEPATVVTIEILNPLQLAARQNWFADKFGSLTPGLIRRIVYDKTRKQCAEILAQMGAEAKVEVRRGQ